MGYTLITGATGGIGKATATLLASEGQNLLLVDIVNPAEFALQIMEEGIAVESLQIDISNLESTQVVTQFVAEKKFTLDGVVHLAGITRDKSMLKMDKSEWDQVIGVNLTGTFNILKVCAPLMKSAGGSIVLTGSTSALFGNFGQINYVASKGGVEAMTKTAARELAAYNIRVNCIIPGFIDTPMTRKMPEERYNAVQQMIPLKRAGQPEDVAELINFLISSKSSYITGTSILIDGGFRM
ncbi:MAG: SDR family oxidoreductase [Candidatus Heimdallarchaeota archaeon]|nr:SDR family oxidoreductase [Candidatus Heimdallarchaeota archaeon]